MSCHVVVVYVVIFVVTLCVVVCLLLFVRCIVLCCDAYACFVLDVFSLCSSPFYLCCVFVCFLSYDYIRGCCLFPNVCWRL